MLHILQCRRGIRCTYVLARLLLLGLSAQMQKSEKLIFDTEKREKAMLGCGRLRCGRNVQW